MADHAAAAAPAGATKPSAAPPKRNVVLIALVAANMVGMLGLGAYLVLGSGGAPAHAEAAGDEEEGDEEEGDEEEGDEEEGEHEMGPLVEFESMVVNLRAETTDRYLKLTFQLELRGEDQLEHVETHMPAFRDAVLMHLTSLTIENVQGAENALHLREQLLAMARQVFGRRSVSHVYFTEYLVQ
jgi:flagellar FliL protein